MFLDVFKYLLGTQKKSIPKTTAKKGMFFAPDKNSRINSKQIYVIFAICCIFVTEILHIQMLIFKD
jgi:hypothetical protein